MSYKFRVAASNAVYESNNLDSHELMYSPSLTVFIAEVPSKITTFQQDLLDAQIVIQLHLNGMSQIMED